MGQWVKYIHDLCMTFDRNIQTFIMNLCLVKIVFGFLHLVRLVHGCFTMSYMLCTFMTFLWPWPICGCWRVSSVSFTYNIYLVKYLIIRRCVFSQFLFCFSALYLPLSKFQSREEDLIIPLTVRVLKKKSFWLCKGKKISIMKHDNVIFYLIFSEYS